MKRAYLIPLLLTLAFAPVPDVRAENMTLGKPRLEIVAQMKQRPGNVAVADDGRMFVSVHPFDNPLYKVLEVTPDGTTKPYPNERWSQEPAGDGVGLGSVLHLMVRGNTLYMLDMGAPRVQPKLVAWDIKKNELQHIWYIPNHAITPQSFLQDFVLTPDDKNVFIADMGQADLAGKGDPAIVQLNLLTGEARRLMAGHATLRSSNKPMMAGGVPLKFSKDGKELPLYLGLNPITMDPKGEWVYYAPMGEGLLSRIRVKDLLDTTILPDALGKKAETVGIKPPSDGILIDGQQNVFVASVADGAIGVINNKGRYTTWLRDPLLSWPDGMAFGPDGGIYLTVNQLHLAASFNKGEDKSVPPYMLVRIMGGRPLEPKK